MKQFKVIGQLSLKNGELVCGKSPGEPCQKLHSVLGDSADGVLRMAWKILGVSDPDQFLDFSKCVNLCSVAEEEKLIDKTVGWIDSEAPVLLKVGCSDKGDRWLVVVGYAVDENARPTDFLVLDPQGHSPICCMWNGILNLDKMPNKKYGYSYSSDWKCLVSLDRAVGFEPVSDKEKNETKKETQEQPDRAKEKTDLPTEEEIVGLFVKVSDGEVRFSVDGNNFYGLQESMPNNDLKIMQAVVRGQEQYFLTGEEAKIKKMTQEDVCAELNVDKACVSRCLGKKLIQTPFGIIGIKTLFSEGYTNAEGETFSAQEVKAYLKGIIKVEDKSRPYSDEELMDKLNEKGYPVARRTVVKYRKSLGIPNSRNRKNQQHNNVL